MKTITEYQPLIFATLLDQAQRRSGRRQTTGRAALRAFVVTLPLLYVVAALRIMSDTGLAIWNWQFWLIFIPVFLLGERLLWALSQEKRSHLARG